MVNKNGGDDRLAPRCYANNGGKISIYTKVIIQKLFSLLGSWVTTFLDM